MFSLFYMSVHIRFSLRMFFLRNAHWIVSDFHKNPVHLGIFFVYSVALNNFTRNLFIIFWVVFFLNVFCTLPYSDFFSSKDNSGLNHKSNGHDYCRFPSVVLTAYCIVIAN